MPTQQLIVHKRGQAQPLLGGSPFARVAQLSRPTEGIPEQTRLASAGPAGAGGLRREARETGTGVDGLPTKKLCRKETFPVDVMSKDPLMNL